MNKEIWKVTLIGFLVLMLLTYWFQNYVKFFFMDKDEVLFHY
jgi:type III secretory pathway component EscU